MTPAWLLKKFFAVFAIFLVVLFFYSNNASKSPATNANAQKTTIGAKDRKVDRWNDIDIYVDEDSVKRGKNEKGEHFEVTVKQVQGGKVIKTNVWTFFRRNPRSAFDFVILWDYKTDEMDNYSMLQYQNKIFEYCMNSIIGWRYETFDQTYIEDGVKHYGGRYYRSR